MENCKIWPGAISSKGYAIFSGVEQHRIVYEREVGPIPPGLQIEAASA